MITEPAKTPEAKMLNQVADTLHNGEIITNTGLIGLPIINTDISSIMKPAMVTPMATMGVAPMATMPTMTMAPEISNLYLYFWLVLHVLTRQNFCTLF